MWNANMARNACSDGSIPVMFAGCNAAGRVPPIYSRGRPDGVAVKAEQTVVRAGISVVGRADSQRSRTGTVGSSRGVRPCLVATGKHPFDGGAVGSLGANRVGGVAVGTGHHLGTDVLPV